MINGNDVKQSVEAVGVFDSYGPISLTIFFTLIILGLVGVFVYLIAKNFREVVNNNTKAIQESVKSSEVIRKDVSNVYMRVDKSFYEVKTKQEAIHTDVLEIQNDLKRFFEPSYRYKYGINDYDMKGFTNEKNDTKS